MTSKWSAEFHPRSLCNFGAGDGSSSSSGDPGGDPGGGFDGGGGFAGSFGGDSFGGDSFGGSDSTSSFGDSNFGGSDTLSGSDTFSGSDSFGGGGNAFGGSDSFGGGGNAFGGSDSFGGGGNAFGGSDSFGGDSTFGGSDTFSGGGGTDGYSGFDSSGYYSGPADSYGQGYATDTTSANFGDWGPTASVDSNSGGPGWGAGPTAGANFGMNNAVGPPGWATGDFGTYGVGGPTSTGFGPGAPGATIGGPGVYAQSPGISGFPGDFNAPTGGALGMPGNVGTQAGPGMPGGPGSVQPGEGLGPGGFGVAPAVSAPPVVPGDRSDVAPTQNFGPQTVSNPSVMDAIVGMFGPNQAQAAPSNFMNTQDTFAKAADMLAQQAQNNPALMEALQTIVAEHNAPAGRDATTFDPNSRADPQALPHGQLGPAFDVANPSVTPGQQNFTAGKTGDVVDDFASRFDAVANPNQTVQTDFQALESKGQPGLPQSEFDSRFGQMQAPAYDPNAAPPARTGDTFDSRFGSPNQFAPTQDTFDSRFGSPNQFAPTGRDTFDSRFGNPDQFNATIGLSRGPNGEINQDVISDVNPATRGVGREAAPLGLVDMIVESVGRGSPAGNPYQAGSMFGPASSQSSQSGRGGSQSSQSSQSGRGSSLGGPFGTGPFGTFATSAGRGGPGYYSTGGPGIAPGAKGAEYGGMYGPGVATGRAGTNTFGVSSREGAYGFYDPATGIYYYQ